MMSRKKHYSNTIPINLFLISDGRNNHYCWIKNMSRLLFNQKSKHKSKLHFCFNCLNSFYCEAALETHREICLNNESVRRFYS